MGDWVFPAGRELLPSGLTVGSGGDLRSGALGEEVREHGEGALMASEPSRPQVSVRMCELLLSPQAPSFPASDAAV